MKPTDDIITAIITRILAVTNPIRIILFGSAARGEMTEHSDLDIMVVVSEGVHRREAAQRIYRNMFGLGMAKDIVVVTEQELERNKDNWSLVYYSALRQGQEIYRAAA